ncbi:MAG: hypothetical protein V4858_05805 [Pseudomonadota bacterium]
MPTPAGCKEVRPTLTNFKNKISSDGEAAASRMLFGWLSCDTQREQLYSDLIEKKEVLAFESRSLLDDHDDKDCCDEDRPKTFRQKAYLVVHPDHVEKAYRNSTASPLQWSHSPYKDLGGTFMLALDQQSRPPVLPTNPKVSPCPFQSHDKQREYCYQLLIDLAPAFDAIATVAFKAGAALPLKQRKFDLADLAETVAVNYVARLFGFSQSDLPMLKATAPKIGNALTHVNVAQHFVTDLAVIPQAKEALATITQRAAELIDLYDQPVGQEQEDRWEDLAEELKQLSDYWFEHPVHGKAQKVQRLKALGPRFMEFKPMMQLMAKDYSVFSTTEKAIMVAGLVGGTITNLRSALCIAVNQFFQLEAHDLTVVRKAAVDARLKHEDANWTDPEAERFRAYVEEALRLNPPAAFVPRRAAVDVTLGGQTIPVDSLIVIAVGGGSWGPNDSHRLGTSRPRFDMCVLPSRSPPAPIAGTRSVAAPTASACPFSRAFGGPPEAKIGDRAEYLHSCIGKDMAMYSITYSVRQLMLLPGLTQALDGQTGKPLGLTKRSGLICERYPLEYEREKLLRQSPLQTVLQVKNPVPENAAALRQVLQFGAPFIEKVLREARHVHFASFMFLDNDSKLILFTAYDGDFDAYIGHFAHEFGPLFDRFFAHIENGPPAPIAEHAFEFVQFLRQFQQPAVGGLFFSAYPEAQADQISWHFNKNRQFDFLTMEGVK